MRRIRAVNGSNGAVLGTSIRVADRWWSRARGMLGRPAPADGAGLLLRPCRSVHMFGMRYALDVAFLDRDERIVAAYSALQPGERSRWHSRAYQALELPTGTLERTGTSVGDLVVLSPQ